MESRARARVILIGGDARRLRSLRLFLDTLGIFEAVAVATGGAGLNALLRQTWAAAIVVDDLNDVAPEQIVQVARNGGSQVPFIGLLPHADRGRIHALYEAGVSEVLVLGVQPTGDVARALARVIERQQLADRVAALEAELARRQIADEATGLYPAWRFDEDWRLEQVRARRRESDLTILTIALDTTPPLDQIPARDRQTILRQVGRTLRASVRDGDIVCHDGAGRFRAMLVDGGAAAAAEITAKINASVRMVLASSGVTGSCQVDFLPAFESGA